MKTLTIWLATAFLAFGQTAFKPQSNANINAAIALDPAASRAAMGVDYQSATSRKLIYVSKSSLATDTRTGLSPYDEAKTFATLTAAKTAATSGDTIIVKPGTYDEKNLLKNGVNWHFHPGAIINYSGSDNGGIWDATTNYGESGAISSVISGHGEFHRAGSGLGADVFNISSTSIVNVSAEFLKGSAISRGFGSGFNDSSSLIVKCDEMISGDGVLDAQKGLLQVHARYLESTGNFAFETDGADGDLVLIVDCETLKGSGAAASEGNARIRCRRFEMTGNDEVIISAGTEVDFHDTEIFFPTASGDSTGVYSAGIVRFVNCRIEHEVASSPALIIPAGGKVIARNSVLVVEGTTTNSVTSTGTLIAMGCFANKAVAAGITQEVGTVTVSADVE